MTEQPPPPPGWYPAYSKRGFERYWDGERWTGQERKKKGAKRGHYIAPAEPSTASGKPAPAPSARERRAEQQAKIVCQLCQVSGQVTVRQERRVKRKTATRIAGAIITAGSSLPVTGVSKRGTVTVLKCSNCGMSWDAPRVKP